MAIQISHLGDGDFSFESLDDTLPNAAKVHYHSRFEVYYLRKGVCWYFIDSKSYRLTSGDIALIPAGIIHKTNYETETYSRSLFYCEDSYIPESVRDLLPSLPYFSGTGPVAEKISQIFAAIQKEHDEPDTFSQDILRSKAAELFLLIARESRAEQPQKEESPIVEKAVRYIQTHYMEAVTLQDVAKECFVSREHLSRSFKKETGFGFNEYLNVYRLKRANSMLKEDSKSRVAEVALTCGFSDSNYFSKQYKKMFGISPNKSRKEGL